MVSGSGVPLRSGSRARVVSLRDTEHAQRLAEMGLTPGTEFTVIKVAPLGCPVEIEFRGSRLCLRRSEFCQMELEPVTP